MDMICYLFTYSLTTYISIPNPNLYWPLLFFIVSQIWCVQVIVMIEFHFIEISTGLTFVTRFIYIFFDPLGSYF